MQRPPESAPRPSPKVFYLWPEHQRTLEIWLLCGTQWRVGGQVATGLDYAGVEALMRLRRLGQGRRATRLMEELQIMERATLAEWSRMREAHQHRCAAN